MPKPTVDCFKPAVSAARFPCCACAHLDRWPETKCRAECSSFPGNKPRKDNRPVLVVVQQGGSSSERYVHTFNTPKQAERYRQSAERASYETADPFQVPRGLADTPGFEDALDAAMDAALQLELPIPTHD